MASAGPRASQTLGWYTVSSAALHFARRILLNAVVLHARATYLAGVLAILRYASTS